MFARPSARMPFSIVNPLTIPDWDRRVAELPGATAFHTTGWARVLTETYGYQPCYVVQQDGARLTGALPLMEVDSWLTGKRGIALPFADACAPLGSAEAREAMRAQACALAAERRWKYLEWRDTGDSLGDAPASTTFFRHTLDLTLGTDVLLQRCDSGTRRAVRKAEQSNLTIEFTRDLEAVRAFYQLLALTRRRHGVPPQPFSFFAALHRHLLAPGNGWIVLARHKGAPIAGILCLHLGRHAIYKYGGSDETQQQLRGNNRVMWEAIRHYAEAGYTTLDFGRTSLANDGLRRFKLGWGTAETALNYIRLDGRNGALLNAPDAATGWHNKVFRSVPLVVSRFLGTLLYKHVP